MRMISRATTYKELMKSLESRVEELHEQLNGAEKEAKGEKERVQTVITRLQDAMIKAILIVSQVSKSTVKMFIPLCRQKRVLLSQLRGLENKQETTNNCPEFLQGSIQRKQL